MMSNQNVSRRVRVALAQFVCQFVLYGTVAAALAGVLSLATLSASAQLSGKGSITGSVTDPTGAVIPGASLTATNTATGFVTTVTAAGAGEFTISPLDPGIYVLTVKATGFETLTQKDVHVNALEVFSYSPKLTVGGSDQTVTVDTAPPALETSNATLGATMESELYEALPIEMGAYGQADQRRATDFAFLMPGVQGNNTSGNATTNTGIINGSGSRGAVSAVYIDGTPFVRAGGNGDPRFVWTAISVDAVDQFQVQTSGYSAIYEGQGIQNYTVKQGGKNYHGSIYEFFRNTALDTFGFLGSIPNAATGKVTKPVEHSNEYGINLSGPLVPFGTWKDKIFAFGNYNGFRYASETPTQITFPTAAQQAGNFQGVNSGGIYDPNTQTACTANNAGKPCRYRYGYVYSGTPASGTSTNPGNAVLGPLGAAGVDVIPAAEFSAVALKMQSFLPTSAITTALQNNYTAANRTGLVNFSTTDRIDYLVTPKDLLTFTVAIGRQASSNPVGQTTAGRNVGPIPYNYGQAYAPKTAVGIIEETHTFTPNLVNQLKYGYARYNGPTFDSDQLPQYAAATLGITGAPVGAASGAFPITTFSGTNAPTQWAGTGPGITLAENYTLLDNLQYVKGRHTITVGGQTAWLLYNVVNATGGSTPITLANAVTETEGLSNAFTAIGSTGAAYASFLIGQVDTTSFTQYIQQEFATRFRAISPYVQDNWKVNSRLTLDLGVRYDFFPTLTEAHNAQSFFSPTTLNPVTGQNGALLFAGSGANTCNCQTPVSNYYKNIGPRLGLAYSLDNKTVIRASYGVMYTHGNAVGGSATSLGTLGYSLAPKFSPSGSLLSTAPFTGANGALPAYASACGVASGPQYGTGYVQSSPASTSCGVTNTSTTAYSGTPLSIGYTDPYLGSRAPEYINYTFGMQRQWSNTFTTTMTYVGSQGHFLPADATNARGFYADQLDPKYLYLGARLADTGTTTTTVAQDCATYNLPCPANFAASQSLAAALHPFPFQGVSDSFGYVSNSNYHALQLSLNMRANHGLTFMANYTWSKAIDDGGTFRTGYNLPGTYTQNGMTYSQDRVERSLSTTDQPQHLVVTGVWALPIGGTVMNHYGWERAAFGGFKFSEILQMFSGSPLAITGSSCPTNQAQSTCEPYLNPAFSGSARVHGKWGAGAVASTTTPISYIATSTCSTTTPASGPFISPTAPTGQTSCLNTPAAPSYTFSSVARTAPLDLFGPGNYQLDLALVRSFHLFEQAHLNFRAEMYNITNKTFFAVVSTAVGNAAFGTVTTNSAYNRRAAQFSARIEF